MSSENNSHTNPQTSRKPTACVIGAGISGVSSALFLAKKGYEVTVLDQRSKVADGATGSATGVLSTIPHPRLGYYHMSLMNNSLSSSFDQVAPVKCSLAKLRTSFKELDIFNTETASNIQNARLTSIAIANKNILFDFINEHKVDVPIGNGELQIANDRVSSTVLKAKTAQSIQLVSKRDAVPLEFADVSRIFPPAILKPLHSHSATLLINSAVLNPVRLTRKMAEECQNLGVDFKLNTRAVELIPNQETKTIDGVRLHDGSIHRADQYVVAAGFPSSVLCSDLVSTPGTLAPVIPVKSYTLDIYDATSDNQIVGGKLPTLFPTYPSTFLTSIDEEKRQKLNYTSFPSSITIGENVMNVENDGSDPRLFRITVGNEYEEINSIVPANVTNSIMDNLKKFATQNIKNSQGSSQRRILTEDERVIIGERTFTVGIPSMGLHCVSKDGLPLAGKAPILNNLYLNTGHGTDPLNSAMICGHTVAQVMKNDLNSKPSFETIDTPLALDTKDDAFYINPKHVDPRRFNVQEVHVQHAFDFTDYEAHARVQASLQNASPQKN